MTNYQNNLPPYAEQITINQEVDQIQEILNQFKQPVPSNFVELEQLNGMCSTQGGKEPACERYRCLINSEGSQVDISHTLLKKLGLEKVKKIPYPVHISSTVLDKGLDQYLAYNVKEEEIFVQKPFTIDNLEADINKLFEKIENLETKKIELERENKELRDELEKEKGGGDKWINDRIENFVYVAGGKACLVSPDLSNYRQALDLGVSFDKSRSVGEIEPKKSKKGVKEKIYQYYRDK